MSVARITRRFQTRRFRTLRLAIIGVIAMLMLAVAANPAFAQTPVPAPPANLTAELTETDGEVQLSWDAAEGATSYRACRRVQNPPGGWSCVSRTATDALFTGLTVDKVYDFAVASYDGRSYSSWVWTEATVETIVHICPISGLVIPDGYLSVGDTTTASGGQTFTLTSISKQASITIGSTKYKPYDNRQYVKVCGTVKAPSTSPTHFLAGYADNTITDTGVGFAESDDDVTDWLDVGVISAGATASACTVWEIPDDASTVIYAVNNFNALPGVFKYELP